MTLTVKDYEEVLADKRRLTRELDEALSGPGNAAKQASLCDLIPIAKKLRIDAERYRYLRHGIKAHDMSNAAYDMAVDESMGQYPMPARHD